MVAEIVRLSDRGENIQLTPREALEEAIKLCERNGAREVIAIVVGAGDDCGFFSWTQGGGQSNERILWNLSFFIKKLKERWF